MGVREHLEGACHGQRIVQRLPHTHVNHVCQGRLFGGRIDVQHLDNTGVVQGREELLQEYIQWWPSVLFWVLNERVVKRVVRNRETHYEASRLTEPHIIYFFRAYTFGLQDFPVGSPCVLLS